MQIEIFDEQGRPVADAASLQCLLDDAHFHAEPVRSAGRRAVYRVSLKQGTPPGHYQGHISIRRKDDEYVLRVLATAVILGPVTVAPPTIFLPDPGDGCKWREPSFVVLASKGTSLGRVMRVDLPAKFFLALASWCAIQGKMHKTGRVVLRRDSQPELRLSPADR